MTCARFWPAHLICTAVKKEDGVQNFEVSGVQHLEQIWDQERAELVTVLNPRVEGKGVIVPQAQGIFRVREFPAWVFCTDDVKRLIEENGFTKCRPRNAGRRIRSSSTG